MIIKQEQYMLDQQDQFLNTCSWADKYKKSINISLEVSSADLAWYAVSK